MKRFCHGRSLNSDPASGPAVTGKVSMNAITLAAGESPGLSQGCGPDEGGRRPIEVRLIVFRCGPASPIWLPSYQFFWLADDPTLFSIAAGGPQFWTLEICKTPPGPVFILAGPYYNTMSAFGGKADMPKNAIDVAIGGKADMRCCTA